MSAHVRLGRIANFRRYVVHKPQTRLTIIGFIDVCFSKQVGQLQTRSVHAWESCANLYERLLNSASVPYLCPPGRFWIGFGLEVQAKSAKNRSNIDRAYGPVSLGKIVCSSSLEFRPKTGPKPARRPRYRPEPLLSNLSTLRTCIVEALMLFCFQHSKNSWASGPRYVSPNHWPIGPRCKSKSMNRCGVKLG